MSVTFYCPCGFSYAGDDVGVPFEHTEPPPGSCCNCGGLDGSPRKCMSCVLRYVHDECQDDCPDCCIEPTAATAKAAAQADGSREDTR